MFGNYSAVREILPSITVQSSVDSPEEAEIVVLLEGNHDNHSLDHPDRIINETIIERLYRGGHDLILVEESSALPPRRLQLPHLRHHPQYRIEGWDDEEFRQRFANGVGKLGAPIKKAIAILQRGLQGIQVKSREMTQACRTLVKFVEEHGNTAPPKWKKQIKKGVRDPINELIRQSTQLLDERELPVIREGLSQRQDTFKKSVLKASQVGTKVFIVMGWRHADHANNEDYQWLARDTQDFLTQLKRPYIIVNPARMNQRLL